MALIAVPHESQVDGIDPDRNPRVSCKSGSETLDSRSRAGVVCQDDAGVGMVGVLEHRSYAGLDVVFGSVNRNDYIDRPQDFPRFIKSAILV